MPRPNLVGELTTQLSWPVVVVGLIGLIASAVLRSQTIELAVVELCTGFMGL